MKKEAKNLFRSIINSKLYYSCIIFFLIYLFIVTVFSLKIFENLHSFTNKSNSMSPAINTGSIIIVRKRTQYSIGDIISYYSLINNKEEIITHRINSLGGNVYITKGDANQAIDREIVLPRLVIGKVIFIIPYLGYIISFAKSGIGLSLSIFFPALIISASELIKIISEVNKLK